MIVTRKLNLTGYGRQDAAFHMVETQIDIEGLMKVLGEKAVRNRTKRTRALAGLITVTVRACQTEAAS